MKLFECHPVIVRYESTEAFFREIGLCADDLVLTNRFILDGDRMENGGAQFLYQEEFGAGEPTDGMLLALCRAVKRPYRRIIGVGGGTVMDLAKLMSLEGFESAEEIHEMMTGARPVQKRCPSLLVPTTCGTGSEVTNVAVLLLESKNIKLGKAAPELYAETAALIPSLLNSLPRRPMLYSAIDALIHACESGLSPKATAMTLLFSMEATERILRCFVKMSEGEVPDEAMLSELLEASAMAGIAFGNAGCGAVHAMSYPIGGKFHLPHGEANYEVFLPVLRYYRTLEDRAPLENWLTVAGKAMNVAPEEALDALEALLEKLCPRRPLREAGATEEDFAAFAVSVVEKQQRLLGNAMRPVTAEIIEQIYRNA